MKKKYDISIQKVWKLRFVLTRKSRRRDFREVPPKRSGTHLHNMHYPLAPTWNVVVHSFVHNITLRHYIIVSMHALLANDKSIYSRYTWHFPSLPTRITCRQYPRILLYFLTSFFIFTPVSYPPYDIPILFFI